MAKHKSDSHGFPSDFGFSGSCSDGPVSVRGHQRARPMAKGGPMVPQPTVIADDAGATPAMEMQPPPPRPKMGGLGQLRGAPGARGAPAFRSKPLIGGR